MNPIYTPKTNTIPDLLIAAAEALTKIPKDMAEQRTPLTFEDEGWLWRASGSPSMIDDYLTWTALTGNSMSGQNWLVAIVDGHCLRKDEIDFDLFLHMRQGKHASRFEFIAVNGALLDSSQLSWAWANHTFRSSPDNVVPFPRFLMEQIAVAELECGNMAQAYDALKRVPAYGLGARHFPGQFANREWREMIQRWQNKMEEAKSRTITSYRAEGYLEAAKILKSELIVRH